ncbi:MAG: replicative DNA helicase, partial [Deltaproteobacteria bacterium]|nr:replicative DNA helicase [Deltaproteobacteria bacterium]
MEKFSKRFGKEPPHDIRAECSVLGSILLDNGSLPSVFENIEGSEDFYLEKHRVIFRGIEELFNRHSSIDVVTLGSLLKDRGEEEKAGGYQYLVSLLEQTPTSANCEYYAKIVRDKALVRKMISAADEIVSLGYGDETEAEDFLSQAETNIFRVSQGRLKSSMDSLQKVMDETGEIIEQLYKNKGQPIGIPSGFKFLDQKLLGFQRSDLIIIAARPSMGKTSLAMNVAVNAARKGYSVAFFSLEMSKDQLATRLLCSEARIDSNTLRSGFITSAQLGEINKKIAQMRQLP